MTTTPEPDRSMENTNGFIRHPGHYLREKRTNSNVTIRQMAAKLGISRVRYGEFERRRAIIPPDLVADIGDALPSLRVSDFRDLIQAARHREERLRPSHIDLVSPFSMSDMFGSVEAEQWAVLMIWALAANGDEWGPVTPTVMAVELRVRVDRQKKDLSKPPSWASNPILRPDGEDLVKRGYAAFVSEGSDRPMIFTPAALERIRARYA